ncbi:hypothetical protein ES702_03853 [subsurface metagenome]
MGFEVVRALPPRGTGLGLGTYRTGVERGFGTPLTEAERFIRHLSNPTAWLSNPWDWDSFKWGFALGGIVITTVGGVILYFTWPHIIASMKVIPVFRAAVEEAKARGLL